MAEKPAAGRMVEIAVGQMTAEQRAAYDRLVSGPRGRLPTPYKVWLQSPKLAEGVEGLGTYLVRGSSLTKQESEIAILVIARHFEAEYVFRAHWQEAEEAGVRRDVVTAIRTKAVPPLANLRELAVYRASVALCQNADIDQQTFDGAVAQLGQRGVADLLALLGYYTSVAFVTKFYAVPLPPLPGAPNIAARKDP